MLAVKLSIVGLLPTNSQLFLVVQQIRHIFTYFVNIPIPNIVSHPQMASIFQLLALVQFFIQPNIDIVHKYSIYRNYREPVSS